MSGIFICYRRKDSGYIAGRLHDRLASHFGADRIFRDIDTIKPGVDFGRRIEDAVSACGAFLVLIGDDWLDDRDPDGRRRIDVPKDWVRQEIQAVLARDVLVVPVLVENARMPGEDDLPASIRELAGRNALELTDQRWDYEVRRLIATLEDVIEPQGLPAPAPPTMPPRWAGTGSGIGVAHPLRPPAHRPRIPIWLKVVLPMVVAIALLLGSVGVAAKLVFTRASTTRTTTKTEVPETSLVTTAPPEITSVTAPVTTAPPPPSTTSVTTAPIRPTRPPNPVTTTKTAPTRVISGPFPTGRVGPLGITVVKIEAFATLVRLHVRVTNNTGGGLTFPTGFFTAKDNTTHPYKVDPSSPWVPGVQPGTVTGIIELEEPLAPGARTMTVGWSVVFGSPSFRDLYVDGIRLT